MTIFFYLPETPEIAIRDAGRSIEDILNRTGALVYTRENTADDVPLPRKSGSPLDAVQAIIIEGSAPDPEVGYLLAYAMAQKKPVLLLTQQGRQHRSPLETFGRRHAVPATVREARYRTEQLERILLSFLSRLGTVTYREAPAIKFTLRITPSLERYLDWKTRNTSVSKADFVRDVLLHEVLEKDEGYRKDRERRRKRSDETAAPDADSAEHA